MKLKYLFLLLFGVAALALRAQERPSPSDNFGAKVFFRVGKGELDPDYKNNKESLNSFINKFRAILSDSNYMVSKLKIVAASSPDGKSETRNIVLAQCRAEAMKSYITSRVRFSPSLIEIENKGENWEGLRIMISASKMRYKKEALQIIDNITDINLRKKRLMFLHNSMPYRYMNKSFFPELRIGMLDSTGISISYKPMPEVKKTEVKQTVDTLQVADQPVAPEYTEIQLPARWAIKTNLLYWGILMPNLEIEYLVSKLWSFNLEGQCAWWSQPDKHKYYQIAMISPEVRYWLTRKAPFAGSYVGFYSGGGLYDLENGNRGYKGECYISTGLSYGFMKSISRHLSLECNLGIGYVNTRHKEYIPIDGRYVYQTTSRYSYAGLTKAKVLLVWRLSRSVKQIKKGGIQ